MLWVNPVVIEHVWWVLYSRIDNSPLIMISGLKNCCLGILTTTPTHEPFDDALCVLRGEINVSIDISMGTTPSVGGHKASDYVSMKPISSNSSVNPGLSRRMRWEVISEGEIERLGE